MPIESKKFERLVQRIAPESILLRIWPLQGGISAEMTAFEITHPDGQISRMILRQPGEQTLQRNPHASEDEFKILQLTTSLGLATPRPYYLDSSRTIFPTPSLIMEYIDGKPEFSSPLRADFTSQLAEHLAKIHSADLSNQDISFLPKHENQCVELSREQSPNMDLAPEHERIRARLGMMAPIAQRNAPGLLHGDFWPGNILWRYNTLVAVIDWEDAKLGDPLIDFAISRLDILWIFGIDAIHSFSDHYQSKMDIDYTNLPYWDLCAALRLARLIGSNLADWTSYFIPFGRHDISESTLREDFRFFITQAFEKLALQ
jgi:aminoglycoside phosphotransferase (APT) family kinase protein